MTQKQLSHWLFSVALAAAFVAGCGGVTAIAPDGGAGRGGSTGSAGTTGASGQGGTTGGAGAGGSSGGAGASDGGLRCSGLTEAQCGAAPGCKVGTCPACDGGTSFAGCYDPTNDGIACTAGCPARAACASLDEAACRVRTDCRVDGCPSCQGATAFARCASVADPPLECPAIQCAACSTVTTLAACEARTDCHSVFRDPGTCGCAGSGCCAKFSSCADGDAAACTGTALCNLAPPRCESPYVVSYAGSCYEGCVKKTDCAP